MAKNPFPYFNFYPNDWLSSQARATMNAEQRGIYIDLLAFAWQSEPPCTLPSDPCELAALAGMGGKWWAENGPYLLKWFVKRGKRLINVKLYHVYTEAMTFRALKREAGKAGNAKRWKNHEKEVSHSDAFATRKPIANVSPSSSSSSSSSSSNTSSEVDKSTSAIPFDPVKELFDKGVALLGGTSRSLIGKLRSRHGDKNAMALILEAQSKTDPTTWLASTMHRDPTKANGGRRLLTATGQVVPVPDGQRVEFVDDPGAIDGYQLPNGTMSFRTGARWLRSGEMNAG